MTFCYEPKLKIIYRPCSFAYDYIVSDLGRKIAISFFKWMLPIIKEDKALVRKIVSVFKNKRGKNYKIVTLTKNKQVKGFIIYNEDIPEKVKLKGITNDAIFINEFFLLNLPHESLRTYIEDMKLFFMTQGIKTIVIKIKYEPNIISELKESGFYELDDEFYAADLQESR
jgi:hypothetical protein